jgi:CelD/BcsL family acetyltransferase involved in cellulose biosynthesis
VFCPLGYGKHVDYLLVRNAIATAFDKNIVYCADISDVLQFRDRELFIRNHGLMPLMYDAALSETKRKLLKSYKQFENNEENYMHPEIYYVTRLTKDSTPQFDIKIYRNEIPSDLLHEWEILWKSSEYKHYFNSPVWFQASKRAFLTKDFVILTGYEKGQLVAVLPLVREKKYGMKVYKMPGGRYFDRSPLLLKSLDKDLLQSLFTAAKSIGSFYLSEIDRYMLDSIVPWVTPVSSAETSVSPFWKLQPDAFRFLAWRHKKALLKKIAEEEGHFDLKVFTTESKEHLKTLMEIERDSSKAHDFKDTFSDTHLLDLYKGLDALAPGSVWFIILYYKGEPICYNYGFHYGDVYSCCGTSFKLAYRNFAPGLLLTYLALPKLIEMGINFFDFSRGISRYKRDFTPYSYQQYGIAYGANFFVHTWLLSWDTIRVWLEHHPKWYERVRVMKNKIWKNL